MRIIQSTLILLLLCHAVHAEMRTWTYQSGKQLEAEYLAYLMKYVLVKNAQGREVRIPMADLSEEDRTFVELINPPTLRVDFIPSSKQRDPKPSPIWENNSPVSAIYYTFGARVSQTSAGDYNHPLTLEIIPISQQIYDPSKYHLLGRIMSEPFVLSNANRRKFEFKDSQEFRTLRYVIASKTPRGEKIAEHLVLVRDVRGEIIAYSSTKNWLINGYDKLAELPNGAWFDRKCNRVHPTSPKEQL